MKNLKMINYFIYEMLIVQIFKEEGFALTLYFY